MEPIERYFQTGEVAINYAEWAKRDLRPLVLIHGISGRWKGWESVLDALAPKWHVYATDLRGHGRSGHAEGPYDRASYSRDTALFIEKIIGEPAYVIGHSLGALTALGVAAARPDLVRAFVMEDPPLYAGDRFKSSSFYEQFVARRTLAESNMTVAQIAHEFSKLLPDAGPDAWRERAECIFQMDHRVWDGVFNGLIATKADSEPMLKSASPPSLLLQAAPEMGGALEDAEAKRALSLLPNARFAKWPDSGHGMHSAFAGRFVKQVEGFFNAV